MGKLKPVATIARAKYPGMVTLSCRYDEGVRKFLKGFTPWARWDKPNKQWVMPDYVGEKLHGHLESSGWQVVAPPPCPAVAMPSRLYEYQRRDAVLACKYGYRFLAYEMGLGKTPAALAALRAWGAEHTLVLCPAGVREVWRDEADKWWPGHPAVTLITTGNDKVPDRGIVVCSHALSSYVAEQEHVWDAIVCDEAHYIKNARCLRGKAAHAVSRRSPRALRLALTGTPIDNAPRDLHSQLDWLTPDRWGNWWRFVNRYCNVEKHDYGHSIYGAKNTAELRTQFDTVGSRATWQQYKHLLPKTVPPQIHRCDNRDQEVNDLCSCVAGRAVVFTYLKRDAYQLAKLLRKSKREVCCATGDMTPTERYDILAQAREGPDTLLVATMDSVGTGIDLTAFPIVIFAGLSYKLSTMLQAIGRVYRLTQKEPVRLHFVVVRGSQEELIAASLQTKIATNASVIDSGNAEEQLSAMVGGSSISDDEFLRELLDATEETYGGSDEYL